MWVAYLLQESFNIGEHQAINHLVKLFNSFGNSQHIYTTLWSRIYVVTYMETVLIGDYSQRKPAWYIDDNLWRSNEYYNIETFIKMFLSIGKSDILFVRGHYRWDSKIPFSTLIRSEGIFRYRRTKPLSGNCSESLAIACNPPERSRIDSNNYTQLLCKSKHAIRFVFLSKSLGQKTLNRQCVTEKQSVRHTGGKSCLDFILSSRFASTDFKINDSLND